MKKVNNDIEEFDWIFGELLSLFEEANGRGCYPHEVDPATFHWAWRILNAQAFPVRQKCFGALLGKLTRPLYPMALKNNKHRHAFFLTH